MYSNLVPFETVVSTVMDDTGFNLLRNSYPKLRRLLYRVEKDIGYGGTAVLKRVKYSIEKGSIIKSGGQYKALLPEDLLQIEAMGMCDEGLCPGDYRIQGNWLFFCGSGSLTEFTLVYYSLLCDGEGNPVTTENHLEAVAAGISYWLYKAKVFRDKGSLQKLGYYEQYYHDRIGEARGQDIIPTTREEWSKAAQILRMSSRDAFIYLKEKRCFCSVQEALNMNDTENQNGGGSGGSSGGNGSENVSAIYSFQFSDLTSNISNAGDIDQAWLDANATERQEADLLAGDTVNYLNTGRIGFAIKTTVPDQYDITDVLGNVLNDTAFDKTYDAVNDLDIYISKQYYTESSVYYKFKLK